MSTPYFHRFPGRSLLLPVLLLAAACAPDDEAATGEETMVEDTTAAASDDAWLDDFATAYEQHYNAGHADSIAAMFAEDAVVLAADGTVAMDREAIVAWNAGQMAEGSPQLDVETIDRMTFGDTAMAIGSYTVSTAAEGEEPRVFGGHWMAAYGRTPAGWESLGLITNYDRQMPVEMLQGSVPAEAPPEQTALGDFIDAYEAAWNAGDAAAVRALFAEDAWVAHADLPAVTDPDAHRQIIADRLGGTIEIHGVESVDLGDGYVADGGWFRMTGTADGEYVGNYWFLVGTNDAGERKIEWLLSNGRPVSAVPSDGSM